MISSDIIFWIFFTFQTCIGFLGNYFLFTLYMYTFLILCHKKKLVDLILAHLTLANALTLIFRGFPNIMSSFGIRPKMGDIGCKAVLYIQRDTRSISLYTTCLQSTFQLLTVTPSNCKWAWLKNKITTFIKSSLLFFWVINMVIYTVAILKTVANWNTTNARLGYCSPYCSQYIQSLSSSNISKYSIHLRFLPSFSSNTQ